jgi:flagellar hook-associated protein 1 FlgK
MSLIGALNVGQTALAVNSATLQVTGNNIANAGNANYTRETSDVTANADQEMQPGVFVGTGVDLSGVQRQVDESLQARLDSANSDYQAATTSQNWSGQIQSIFNALGTSNLDTAMSSFYGSFSTLASNPQDSAQRQEVIQAGVSLASEFNSVGGQLQDLQQNIGQQLTSLTGSANTLASQIASLNQQISTSNGGGASPGGNNALLDQRDALVGQLSQLANVQTVNQGNGTVNVYLGSEPLVMGTSSRGLTVTPVTVNGEPTYQLNFASDGATATVTSGQIGALLTSQTQANSVTGQLNTLAAGVINAVNTIHASGQGTSGFTSVTATNQVLDSTAALNSTGAGLAFPPQNGSFVVHVTNAATGLSSSTLVQVNLTGSGSDTTLNSLATSLNAISGVQASISGGYLTIATTAPNTQITFSQDTSNTLAGLGINTFFSGEDASSIAVNSQLAANPSLLAAAQDGNSDDNSNALAIASADTVNQTLLGGTTTQSTYTNMINGISSTAAAAQSNSTATQDIVNTLQSQRDATSGVSLDEEAINLIQEQQAYQGAARLISTIDQLFTTLMNIT